MFIVLFVLNININTGTLKINMLIPMSMAPTSVFIITRRVLGQLFFIIKSLFTAKVLYGTLSAVP